MPKMTRDADQRICLQMGAILFIAEALRRLGVYYGWMLLDLLGLGILIFTVAGLIRAGFTAILQGSKGGVENG